MIFHKKENHFNDHARSLKATLITNNVHEFERVKGLKIENWA